MANPRTRARSAGLALALALLASLALPAPAMALRRIGLSTPSFDFNVAPGGTGKGELNVINDGDEPIDVMVYFAAQKIDAKGQVTFDVPRLDRQDSAGSSISWFQLKVPEDTRSIGNVPYLQMKPKERMQIDFSFEVPDGAAPGDHQTVLFFEMFDLKKPTQAGAASAIMGRLGSRIRVRVQGEFVESFDVRPFSVRDLVIGDKMPYSFVLRNDGNLDKPISADMVIRDANEADRITSKPITDTVVFAKSMLEQSGVLDVGALGVGKYTALLTVTYPKGEQAEASTIVKERVVWVVPLWLAIAAVVLVGLLVIALMWRGAVRSGRRRAQRRAAAVAAVDTTDAELDEPGAVVQRAWVDDDV